MTRSAELQLPPRSTSAPTPLTAQSRSVHTSTRAGIEMARCEMHFRVHPSHEVVRMHRVQGLARWGRPGTVTCRLSRCGPSPAAPTAIRQVRRGLFTRHCCGCDLDQSVGSDSVSLGRLNGPLQLHKLARGSVRTRGTELQRERKTGNYNAIKGLLGKKSRRTRQAVSDCASDGR